MPIDLSVEKLTAAADFAAKYPTVFAQRIDRGVETMLTEARVADEKSICEMTRAESDANIIKYYK